MPLPRHRFAHGRVSCWSAGCPVPVAFRGWRSYDDDLRFAHVLADAADDITTKRFRALDLRVETKPDLTPVSDADRATEESLRNILRRSRPRDAVLGEESGQTGTGPRRWVIDPIDATKNYVRGVPVWATLIGLMDGDEVVVGVVTAPALGRRWWAAAGGGAWTGPVADQGHPAARSPRSPSCPTPRSPTRASAAGRRRAGSTVSSR